MYIDVLFYYCLDVLKDDSESFIFTLKNPYSVPPVRYQKQKGNKKAIVCCYINGPIFGNTDIRIGDHCNENGNMIGCKSYEYHPQYKKSLYVDMNGPEENNSFAVSDYEVFSSDTLYQRLIFKVCKYPEIVWKLITSREPLEECLEQVENEQELLDDFDRIHCADDRILLKVSNYYMKNPSEFLPHTHLVDMQYDSILREWIGDHKMKLIYRASEHEYTAESFFKYCNVRGPTLIVIKSTGGWIFGGYTTQSWNKWRMFLPEKLVYS